MPKVAAEVVSITRKWLGLGSRLRTFSNPITHANVVTGLRGWVQMELEVTPEMTGADNKTVAPGCLFTAFDEFSVVALKTLDERIPVSVAAQMHYAYPAQLGDTLIVDAKVINKDGPYLHMEVDFHSKKTGMLVAKGGQTMSYPGGKGMIVIE